MFRCKSILLHSHWVLVVMDLFTRRIIAFGVHDGDVDGVVLCRMSYTAISAKDVPKYLSSDTVTPGKSISTTCSNCRLQL